MARLFFAVTVTPEVAALVDARKAALRRLLPADEVRFTSAAQSHLTLRFLGEQSADRQEAALRAGRRVAAISQSFELVLESVGVFPDGRRPHTLWLGTGAGGSKLVAVAARLDQLLQEEGFAAEERPLIPHLTVARIKGRLPERALEAILAEGATRVGTFRVESFALMESRPAGRFHAHTSLEVFTLTGS